MKFKILSWFAVVMLLSGCNSAMVVNGKVMGISSGKLIYQDGYLTTQYHADIEQVWNACKKTVTELKGRDIERERKISSGSLRAVISDEKVTILVEYVEKGVTTVSVFSGLTGNNIASKLIQDKIASHIAKP
ncbi:MAG: DUF3568 family protein [Syntrophaceae bacterium]|jgi:hypothetical protein|nr:DUF3568 family protein [Syntrophaceae bacterium]HOC60741.1 DUF3568 family protein [Smithellaceae bacterium]HQM46241.1 DUF3568 family protein [Smithellaceae bacterium]